MSQSRDAKPDIRLQSFTVQTTGGADDLEVQGASIPEDQLDLLLKTPPGVLYAENQYGVVIELMLDMDQESLIARPVLLHGKDVEYLDATGDEASMAP